MSRSGDRRQEIGRLRRGELAGIREPILSRAVRESGGHDVRDEWRAPGPASVPPQDLLNEFLRVLADAGDALVCRESMLAV
jgi:hypothetical protein